MKSPRRLFLGESVNVPLGVGEKGECCVLWCGGWDLNPRRPTPSGPKPDPFVQARAPPHRGEGFRFSSFWSWNIVLCGGYNLVSLGYFNSI